jgi:hypothetical protein
MILTLDLKNAQNKSIPLPFAASLVACLQERKTFILSLSLSFTQTLNGSWVHSWKEERGELN